MAALRPALRGAFHRASVPVAIFLTVVLAARATRRQRPRAAVIVYGVCVVAMLTVSGVYHLPRLFTRDRRVLRRLDHATILVAIAGTYTAVIVIGMSGSDTSRPALADLGGCGGRHRRAHALVRRRRRHCRRVSRHRLVPARQPCGLLQALDGVEFALLAAGGLLYTGGAVMFFLRRPDPWPATFGYHEIWHTCVVVAAFCHWLSVYMLAE